MLYLDTSALAKLYVWEAGTADVQALVAQNAGRLFTSVATFAEVFSVLTRCLRERRFSRSSYRAQRRSFLADWSGLHVVELTTPVLSPADRLIQRHGLRGLDAIQLCSALWIGRPRFVCFDLRLRLAAQREGLPAAPDGPL